MKLALTVPTLRAAYTLLVSTKPFSTWKMPNPDEVDFEVMRNPRLDGECGDGLIRISSNRHATILTLLTTMSHESVHLFQQTHGFETANVVHNADFRKRLKRVCEVLGFDPKATL